MRTWRSSARGAGPRASRRSSPGVSSGQVRRSARGHGRRWCARTRGFAGTGPHRRPMTRLGSRWRSIVSMTITRGRCRSSVRRIPVSTRNSAPSTSIFTASIPWGSSHVARTDEFVQHADGHLRDDPTIVVEQRALGRVVRMLRIGTKRKRSRPRRSAPTRTARNRHARPRARASDLRSCAASGARFERQHPPLVPYELRDGQDEEPGVGSDVEEDVAGPQRVHEELHEDRVLFGARVVDPGRRTRPAVSDACNDSQTPAGILWFGLLR